MIVILIIPAVRLVLLLALGLIYVNWYEYILPVFLVFLFTQIATIITRKACGYPTGKWRRMLGGLVILTGVFTFGIIGSIAYVVTGGQPLFQVGFPLFTTNIVYLIVILASWIVLAFLNEWMFK